MKIRRLLALALCLCLLPLGGALSEHFALTGRDCGPCKKLLGDVEILLIFVNTPAHPWTQKQKDAVFKVSWSSIDYMHKNAKQYHANLNLSFAYFEFSVDYEVRKDDLTWYWDILHKDFHANSIADVIDAYRKGLHKDDVPFIFLFNSWDLSHTYMCYNNYPGWNEEFCVIYCDTEMHGNYLTHELYHQYGAIDLYDYNKEGIAKITRRYFPNNVMACTGTNVDDLTAYLLGWTDTLTPKAQRFLSEIDGRR